MSSAKQFTTEDIIEFLKHANFLRLTNDAVFKTYFKDNKDLLESLIVNFVPLPKGSVIIYIEVLDPELPSNKLIKGILNKNYILDLRVKFEIEIAGRKYIKTVNIEVQTTSDPYLTDRVLVYGSRLYSQQLGRGSGYHQLSDVYSLVFVTQNLSILKEVKEYYHIFKICRQESPHIVMSEGLTFVVVELGKFDKGSDELYSEKESWAYFLKHSNHIRAKDFERFNKQGGIMPEAMKRLWNLSQDEALREYLDAIEKKRLDRLSREEFVREESLQKGRAEGRVEGQAEGRAEGQVEGRQEVALNMLKAGIDPKVIIDTTGLSEKELKDLKNKDV